MGDYIRYHEAERLFKLYPTLQTLQKTLQTELINISNANKDEDIYSESMGNRIIDGMPHSGGIPDKTASVAMKYQNANKREIIELRQDIIDLDTVIDKLTCVITSMGKIQILVLESYYWNDNTWQQVLDILSEHGYYMSESKARRVRKAAITYIATVSKITVEQYRLAVGLVE